MDLIKNIVREIVLIVLLASFLEMLLPKSNMKRFVQVILGLFILISILNPITSLFSNDEMVFQIEAWQYQPQSNIQLEDIIAQGQHLSQTNENLALRDYELRIEKQINALVQLLPGVKYTEVSVAVGTRSSSNFGEIQQVVVNIYQEPPASQLHRQVEKVQVDEIVINIQELPGKAADKSQEEAVIDVPQAREVAHFISNFYSLPAEKIEVNIL